MIDERIAKFLAEHHVLTLATEDEKGPYCCNLFYVYLPQRNWFVATSAADTLHVRQATRNPRVAASVVLETSVVGKVRGLQLRGTMAWPEGEERRVARNAYLRRFPFAAVMDLELWIIRPVFFKYTDNRLGFGKKIIWENDTNS